MKGSLKNPAAAWPFPSRKSAPVDTEDSLCTELKNWCQQQDLPYLSADELMLQDGISEDQSDFLRDYITRWDDMLEQRSGVAS